MVDEDQILILNGQWPPMPNSYAEDYDEATISGNNHEGNVNGNDSVSNSSRRKTTNKTLGADGLTKLIHDAKEFIDEVMQKYLRKYRLKAPVRKGDPEWLATWLDWEAIYHRFKGWDIALIAQPEMFRVVYLAGRVGGRKFKKFLRRIPEEKLRSAEEEQDESIKAMAKSLRKSYKRQTAQDEKQYYNRDPCSSGGKTLEEYIAEAVELLDDLKDVFFERDCSHPDSDIPEWWFTLDYWKGLHNRFRKDMNRLLEESEMYVMLDTAAKVAPEIFEPVVDLTPLSHKPPLDRLVEDDLIVMVRDLRRVYLLGDGMPELD